MLLSVFCSYLIITFIRRIILETLLTLAALTIAWQNRIVCSTHWYYFEHFLPDYNFILFYVDDCINTMFSLFFTCSLIRDLSITKIQVMGIFYYLVFMHFTNYLLVLTYWVNPWLIINTKMLAILFISLNWLCADIINFQCLRFFIQLLNKILK